MSVTFGRKAASDPAVDQSLRSRAFSLVLETAGLSARPASCSRPRRLSTRF